MTEGQPKVEQAEETRCLRVELRRDRRGLTLIELMVALTIAAGLVAGSIGIVETLNRSKLKGEVVKLTGVIKYAHARAIIDQKYYQLGLNLSSGSYQVKVASSDRPGAPPTIPKQNLIGAPEDVTRSGSFGGEVGSDAPAEGAGLEASTDKNLKQQQLENGVKFMKVYTPGEEDGVEEGEATLMFFPNGFVEPSMIVLGEENSGVFSLEVEPMTGKVRVLSGAQSPDGDFFEGEED